MPRKTRRAPGAGTVIELPSGRFRVQVRTLDGGREGHTAKWLGTGDAPSAPVAWRYAQRRAKGYAVEVRVEGT